MPGCGILKRTEVASLVANGERKPSILGQEMVRGELGKQNRRRCSITVLEGLRGEFTRDTVLAPTC